MIIERVQREAASRLKAWAQGQGVEAPRHFTFAPAPAHVPADFSLPWPLSLAKAMGRKPLEVAAQLAEALRDLGGVETPQAVAPGFVNFKLRPEALAENLRALLAKPGEYGRDPDVAARSLLIEFVSANPTGPLHLASGRGATLGDSLAKILRRIGHKVGCECYINDGGARAELLGRSAQARYLQLQGKPAEVPTDGYQGEYLKEVAAAAPPEAAGWDEHAWGRYAMELMLASHKADMDAFGVAFDRWFRESELYASKAVESTLDYLRKRGMVYEKEGAVWLGTSQLEAGADDKDRVLVKSDGNPTYFLPDIAYHKNKFDRGWTELVDIWGADHHGYVPRMRAAIAALCRPPEYFHAIIHQLVHLYRGTTAVKMSKRAGEFVTLREVVEEVGRDACRFFFALRTANSHMNFDLELAKKQSQENPVYYVQYVHARICSIFREAEKVLGEKRAEFDAAMLRSPEERALLAKTAWFPAALRSCEAELSPHFLANYLLELAGLFHPFYEKCRVVDAVQAELSRARLALCGGVRAVIAEGLGLLGVSAPERM